MFVNKYNFYEKIYLEELEVIEKEMAAHPFIMQYVEEWKLIAEMIKDLRFAKENNF